MKSIIDRSKYRNPPPPPDSEDCFDKIRVTLLRIPTTVLDAEFGQLLTLYEDELKSPPGSDDSDISISDEDNKESMKLLLKKATGKQSSNSASVEIHHPSTSLTPALKQIKIENLSDGEIPSEKGSPRKEPVKKKDTKRYSPPKRKNRLGLEYSDSDESGSEPEPLTRPKYENKSIKREQENEIDEKQIPGISESLSDYYCKVCNIVLNSEATMQTHLLGRRHKKALNAQNVPELAYEALSHMAEQSKLPYNYPIPAPKMKHVKVHQRPKLQPLIDGYTKGPLAGLKYVTELHIGNEIKYYCNLCHSPCSVSSIMQHLVGKLHRQYMCDVLDEKYKHRTHYGDENPERQEKILYDYEKRHGRDRMRVEIEVRDESPDPELCSSRSSRNYDDCQPSTSRGTDTKPGVFSAVEDLDTSRNDFYCTVCDSHMNSQGMWESHIRGKRHLKNKKKVPGEAVSKMKSIWCPNETANLLKVLEDVEEPIVGLDYIRETKGEAGDFYNCFLCGACVTNFDIIEHLVNVKHQTKYLETVNKKGQENGIESIKLCYELPPFQRNALIKEECEKLLCKYGAGTVSVYRSKDAYHKEKKRY